MTKKVFDFARKNPMGLTTSSAQKLVEATKSKIAEIDSRIKASDNPREIEKLNRHKSELQAELDKSFAILDGGNKLPAEVKSKVGDIIATKQFGFSRVSFYSNGYVQVKKSEPELLLKITSSDNTTSKTLPGRAISQGLLAIPTGGMSLITGAVTPNRRGVLTLTIVTDVTAHVLSTNVPSDGELRAMYEIEGLGNSLIAKRQADQEISTNHRESTTNEPITLSTEITKLNDLLSQGVITQDEFDKAKAKLLS